jgi:hypothetical protein
MSAIGGTQNLVQDVECKAIYSLKVIRQFRGTYARKEQKHNRLHSVRHFYLTILKFIAKKFVALMCIVLSYLEIHMVKTL